MTKRNQGDATSSGGNALFNDHHIITAIPESPLCPLEFYKRYVSLLHSESNAFFQKPNKSKKGYSCEVIGKNTLGLLMKEISKQTGLSKEYTNHSIRKITATGLRKSVFSLEEIANVTKHKN